MMRILSWLAGALLLAVAVFIDDPYFASQRETLWMFVLALSVCGALLAFRGRATGPGRALLALWCAIPLAMGAVKVSERLCVARVLSASAEKTKIYGSHFIVGYGRVDEVETLAARGLIGGVFVTRHNIGQGVDALRGEIAHLQQLRRDAGLPPLIVATDQEGGLVSHLSPPLPVRPSLAERAALPAPQRAAEAEAQGAALGAELATLGVTQDFAPVVDLKPAASAGALDFNSFISQRAISADPAVVRDIAAAFARGLAQAGVTPTLKHFPGLGRIAEDTHHFRAHLVESPEALEASDWRPFRETLSPMTALMVGHVVVDALDPDRPASQSRAVVDGLLRKTWGFDGLVVTDDLNMGSVFHHGICAGVAASLNAGVDLLLVSYDGRQFWPLMDCVLAADARGEIDAPAMARSAGRLESSRARTRQ